MPGTVWSTEHEGRTIEVVPDGLFEAGDAVRLIVDGVVADEAKAEGAQTLSGEGIRVDVKLPVWGGSVVEAEVVGEDGAPGVALAPAAGSRAARRLRFAAEHPELFAARHVVKGTAQVLAGLVGFGFLLSLLPTLPLPHLDLPSVDLPDLPWPDVHLPSFSLPGPVRALLDASHFVVPILIGIVLAVREVRRRRAEDGAGGVPRST